MNIDELFLKYRTCYEFSEQQVDPQLLREIYDVSKYGSTSFNCSPLRVIFIHSEEQKKLLLDCVVPGNLEKTRSAPVTAIFAYDLEFYTHLPHLFPHMPVADMFAKNQALSLETILRNSSLQAAYFMLVARSKGLAYGAMSGFDTAKVEEYFLKDTKYKVNFLCNLGYQKINSERKTLPRLSFEDACKFI